MNKYKEGDEVLVRGKISASSTTPLPYQINFAGWNLWLPANVIHSLVNEPTAIPEGWNPASLNPDTVRITNTMDDYIRNLQLLRADGTQGYGWKWGDDEWKWFGVEFKPEMIDPKYNPDSVIIRDVIAWKELDPLSALPDGWNLPDTLKYQPGKEWTRNVQVLYKDGTQGYGYKDSTSWNTRSDYTPRLHDPKDSCSMISIRSDEIVGWKELEPETPKLPDGWNSPDTLANEPDSSYTRNVQVLLNDNETGYGYRGNLDYWAITKTFDPKMHNLQFDLNGETLVDDVSYSVIGWKELDPLPRLKVGDSVIDRNDFNLGIGVIVRIDYTDPDCPYLADFPSYPGYWVREGAAVKVDV